VIIDSGIFIAVMLAIMVYACLAVTLLGQFFIIWLAWLNSKPLFYGLVFTYVSMLVLFFKVIAV
jgi:hypothetical protein